MFLSEFARQAEEEQKAQSRGKRKGQIENSRYSDEGESETVRYVNARLNPDNDAVEQSELDVEPEEQPDDDTIEAEVIEHGR